MSAVLLGLCSVATAQEQSPPAAKPPAGKLVCVGDSITEGALATRPERCYVSRIRSLASEAHCDLQVVNEGRSGWSTGAFAANAAALAAKLPVDATLITIMLGTNDTRENGLPGKIAEEAADHLDKLIKLYREKVPGVEVVLITPPAAYPSKFTEELRRAHYEENTPEKLMAIDAAYQSLARRLGLRLIDVSKLPGSEHSPDGVHPDDDGHAKLAEWIWRALNGDPAPGLPASAAESSKPSGGSW